MLGMGVSDIWITKVVAYYCMKPSLFDHVEIVKTDENYQNSLRDDNATCSFR